MSRALLALVALLLALTVSGCAELAVGAGNVEVSQRVADVCQLALAGLLVQLVLFAFGADSELRWAAFVGTGLFVADAISTVVVPSRRRPEWMRVLSRRR